MNNPLKVLVLQHVECETLGTIEQALHAHSIVAHYVRIHQADDIPATLGDFAGLIVMGGPMSVYEADTRPHLRQEMKLIEAALAAECPILGICLGSQLLANVLGAKVYPGPRKEIGWHPVTLTDATRSDSLWSPLSATFPAFHWHGDVFDVPANTVRLASSELTACQAFRAGLSAYGILFHLEVTEPLIANIAAAFPQDLASVGSDANHLAAESRKYQAGLATMSQIVFDGWARLVAGNSSCIELNSGRQ